MIISKVEFKRTPEYEVLVEMLKDGKNVYLQGASCKGKTVMARELQYDLDMEYCYLSIPKEVECTTLNNLCQQIASQFKIDAKRDCRSGVCAEDTLAGIRELKRNTLFVFDNVGHVANSHSSVKASFNNWVHELLIIKGCQVLCVIQIPLTKTLPIFFTNKALRGVFDLFSLDNEEVDLQSVDIKRTMQSWFKSELARGEYPEPFLKVLSMGMVGELPLCAAVNAASAIANRWRNS